ncbi:unnamed protein product [Closterium sp. NIES-53]
MAPAHGEHPHYAMASMSGGVGAAHDDTVGMFASYGSYGSSRSSRSGRIPSSDFTGDVDIISTNSSTATTVNSGGFSASHDSDFTGSKSGRFPSDLPPFFPSYSNNSRSPNRSPARTSSSPVHLPDNVPRFGAFCGAATGQSGELPRLGGGDHSSRPSSAGGSPLASPSPQPPPRLSGEFFRDPTFSNGANGPYPAVAGATAAFYRDPTLSMGNCNSGPLPRISRDTSRNGSPFGGSPLASATNSPRNFSRSNSGSGAAGGARIATKEPTYNSKGMSLSAAISMSHKEQVQRWGVNHALPQQCGSSGSSVTSHDGGGGAGGATSGHMFPPSYHPDALYSPMHVHGGVAEDGGAGARSGASAIAMRSLHGRRTSSGMVRMTGLGGGGGGGGGGYGGFSTPGSPDNLLFPPHSALPLSAGTSPDHPHFGGAAAGGGIGRSHLAGGVVARSHSLLRTSNNGAGPTRSEIPLRFFPSDGAPPRSYSRFLCPAPHSSRYRFCILSPSFALSPFLSATHVFSPLPPPPAPPARPTRAGKDDLTLLMDARARNKLGAQGDWSQSGSRSPDSLAFSASGRSNGSGSLQALMDFRPYNGAASAGGAGGNAAGVNGAGGMQRLGGGKGAFSGALSVDLESDLAGVSLTESDCVPVGEVLHASCVGNTGAAAATARGGEGTGEGEDEEELSLVPCLNWEGTLLGWGRFFLALMWFLLCAPFVLPPPPLSPRPPSAYPLSTHSPPPSLPNTPLHTPLTTLFSTPLPSSLPALLSTPLLRAAVEALCLDMELDRRHIEAIHILHTGPPAPASQAGAGAGAAALAGAGTGAAGGAVPWCSGVDPPVVYALQFAGADEWYWPGCGGLLGGTAAATVA